MLEVVKLLRELAAVVRRRLDLLRVVIALTLPVLAIGGCGYHFSGQGAGPRPGVHKVAIPLFVNDTAERDLESIFADRLRKEFITKGAMEVVPVDQAQAVFRGHIIKIYTIEAAHREVEDTLLTRLFLVLNIRCEDAENGAVLWKADHFRYFEEYFQSDDPIVSFENRRRALEVIAEEMAVRIHDRFLSNF